MTYASKGEKVFELQDPVYPDCTPPRIKRSDHRLKLFPSNYDRRTWDMFDEVRYRALYELISGSQTCLIGGDSCHKYVPLEDLIRILMADKDALIKELQDKLRRCMEKEINEKEKEEQSELAAPIDRLGELTDELNNSREMLRKAMHKLQNIDEIVNENRTLQCRLRCSEERVKYLEEKKKNLECELEDLRSKSQIQIDLERAQDMLQQVSQSKGGSFDRGRDTLTEERDKLQEKVRELERELEESKKKEAEIQMLKDGFDKEEISMENECYRKKLASMRCLEKQIQDLKKHGIALADKYKREVQKAAEQMNRMCQTAKELQALREERDCLRNRVKELSSYEGLYNDLQRKLRSVEEIIAENEMLNCKMVALGKLERENEYLRCRLNRIQEMEDTAAEDKERIMQLQCAVADQEEEMKELLCQIERLTSGTHQEEIERLRCELYEKNSKLKLCEEQLAEIPMLEAEIDELRMKLQICCREFPERKMVKSNFQRIEVRLPSPMAGICAKYRNQGQTASPCIKSRDESRGERRAESRGERKAGSKGSSGVETVCESTDESKHSTRGESKAGSKGSSRIENVCESTSESKHSTRGESKGSSRVESVCESTGESKGGSKGSSRVESVCESKYSSRIESKCESLIESRGESRIGSRAPSRAQSRAQSRAHSRSGSNTSRKTDSCEEILKGSVRTKEDRLSCRSTEPCQPNDMMSCEEVQNLLQSSKGIISCVLEDMIEHQKEMEQLEKRNRVMKDEIETLKTKIGTDDDLKEEINCLRKALEQANDELCCLREADRSSNEDMEMLRELNCQMKAELQAACEGLKQISLLEKKLEMEHKARCLAEQKLKGGKMDDQTLDYLKSGDPNPEVCRALQKEVADLKSQIVELNKLTDELKRENGLLRELQKPCPDFSKELDEKCALENLLSLLQAELDAYKGQKLSNECEALRNELKRVMEQNCQLKILVDCYRQRLDLEQKSKTLVQELPVRGADKDLPQRGFLELQDRRDQFTQTLSSFWDQEVIHFTPSKEIKHEHSFLPTIGSKSEDLRLFEVEFERLKKELDEKEQKLKLKEAELQSKEEELKLKEEEANEAKEKAKAAENEAKMAQMHAKEAEDDAKAAHEKLKAAEEEAKAAEEKAKVAQEEAKAALEQVKEVQEKGPVIKEAEDKAQEATDKAKAAREKAKQAFDEVAAAQEKAVAMHMKAKGAEETLKTAQQEAMGAHEQLQAAKQEIKKVQEKAETMEKKKEEVVKRRETKAAFLAAEAAKKEEEQTAEEELQRLRQRMKEMEDEHAEKLRALVEQHQKELAQRDKAYNDNLNAMKAGYETDIRKLASRHKQSITKLQGMHEDQMREMSSAHESQMEIMHTQSQAAVGDVMKKMKEKHDMEMKDKAREMDGLRDEVSKSQRELETLKRELGSQASDLKAEKAKHAREITAIRRASQRKLSALQEALKKKTSEYCDCKLRRKQRKPRDPTCPLDFYDVIEKIMDQGLECLTFNEIALVHRKACCALERMVLNSDVTPTLDPPVGNSCPNIPLLEADRQQLLKRIFVLENDIREKQKLTQDTIINMEVAIKKERCRLLEIKKMLMDEQQRNSDLKLVIQSQSQMHTNLKKERDELGNQASLHQSLCAEKLKELDQEKQQKKCLEGEVERLKMQVKQLCFAAEMSHGRSDCRDNDQIEMLRLKLEQAQSQERKLAYQLENETKCRMQLQCQVQALRQSFRQMINIPTAAIGSQISVPQNASPLDVKSAKEKENFDQVKEKKNKSAPPKKTKKEKKPPNYLS